MPTLASETGRIHFHKIISLLGAVLAFAGMTACDSFLEPQLQADLQVNTSSVHFTALSDSRQLTATVLNAIGDPIAEPDLQWSSTDPAIASVSGAGVVTSRATGQAQVTVKARCCDVSKKVEVTIEQVPTVLLVTPDQAEMDVGDTLRIDARAEDANGNAIQGLTFTTQDGTVAAVSDDGVVSAKGEGTTAVEVSVGAVRAQADVKVRGKTNTEVSEIRASVDSYQFKALGDVLDASADALDASGNVVHGIAFDWSSSNASVATVDKNGRITAVADGSATITVSAPCCGKSDQIAITVSPPPATSLVLDPGEVSVDVGQTVQLSVKDNQGHPVGGATFSSSNAAAATVGSDGKVKGVGAGSATITAKAGTLSGKASVNVVATTPPPPTVDVARVQVSKAALAFTALGDTARLSATALDGSGGTVSEVSFGWSSSNASVVTVDSMGLLTARSVGTASVVVAALCCSAADTVAVTVEQLPATISVSSPTTSVGVGQSVQLSAQVLDANAYPISAGVSWSSSNTGVATVSSTGLVQGKGAGSAAIKASGSGRSASVGVTVHATQTPTAGTPLFSDDFEGHAVGSDVDGNGSNGFFWMGSSHVDGVSNLVSHSGTKSLRFRWDGQANSEQRFKHPQVTEYWVEYYVYFPDGTEDDGAGGALNRYEHRANNGSAAGTNNKFYTFWSDDYQARPRGTFQLWHSGTDGSFVNVGRTEGDVISNTIKYPNTSSSAHTGLTGTDLVGSDADRGRWMQIRVHLKVADYGQENGAEQMWKDGSLIVSVVNDPFYDDDNGANYLQNGYLMGWANSGFRVDTSVFIDDFRMYTTNPGW